EEGHASSVWVPEGGFGSSSRPGGQAGWDGNAAEPSRHDGWSGQPRYIDGLQESVRSGRRTRAMASAAIERPVASNSTDPGSGAAKAEGRKSVALFTLPTTTEKSP